MSDDLRRQGLLEPYGEPEHAVRPPDRQAYFPVPVSSRSIAISLVSAIAALVYVCSPIDLVPEVLVPVVGFVDDLLVLVGGLTFAGVVLAAALAQRAKNRQSLRGPEDIEHVYGKWPS